MNTKALVTIALVFLSGCASQQKSVSTFPGHAPVAFDNEAGEIWQRQLAKARRGRPNNISVRAVREGDAEISLDDGKSWRRAKVGGVLSETSWVRTGNGATVDLFLGDNGPVVRVTQDSEVRFLRLDSENTGIEKVIDTMIELPKGRILGNVKKLTAESSYLVRTRNGIVQIRGTEFSIKDDGELSILSGLGVLVRDSKSIEVNAGERFVPSKNEKEKYVVDDPITIGPCGGGIPPTPATLPTPWEIRRRID